MPRPAALLCLLIALAAQPLRQAEAASDYARALTHLLAPTDVIEIPDGGVGDDSGDATLKAGTSPTAVAVWSSACDLCGALGGLPLSFILAPSTPDPLTSRRQTEEAVWLPLGACQRHAWLQSFRF